MKQHMFYMLFNFFVTVLW